MGSGGSRRMTAYPTGPESGVVYTLENAEGYQAVFNDSTSANFAGVLTGEDAVTGLESPEIRESFVETTEGDGGDHGTFFTGRRPITLQAEVVGATPAARNAMLTRIARASMALRSDATLKFTPSGSIPQFVSVRRQQPLRAPGGWKKRVFISLVAEDPRIYSQALYTSAPILTGTPGSLENQGSSESYPVVRINGPGTKPTITAGGRSLTFKSTFSLTAGQYVDVDLLNSAVTHSDGTSRYSSVDWVNSTWWGLVPGINSVSVSWLSGNTAASTIVVSWRDAWM